MSRLVTSAVAAGLLAGGFLAGNWAAADAPAARPAAPLRAGYVSAAEFMKRCKKWQDRAKAMAGKRDDTTRRLAALRAAADARKAEAAAAPAADKKEAEAEAVLAQRKFEDAERKARQDLDDQSGCHLKELYAEFAAAVTALAGERKLDVVHLYPARPGVGMGTEVTAQMIDFMMRPPAMTPFFLRDELDLTDEVLARLNRAYEADLAKAERDADE